ncbi:hypothetical protein [Natronomonas gomsonensis]|nr:hypothetical protein [Natronomonas gomsonensis]
MTDETQTNEALEQWKAEMQAEHEPPSRTRTRTRTTESRASRR